MKLGILLFAFALGVGCRALHPSTTANTFTDARSIAKDLGDVRVMSVEIKANYFEAFVNTKGDEVDSISVLNGTRQSPQPVNLTGQGKLSENLFPLSSVNWGGYEKAMKASVSEGEIVSIAIKRDLPFSPEVKIFVTVSSPRKSNVLKYSLDGTLQKPV